ncbi:MAG: glycosyltransferase family 4 protein [Acidobacteriia bacterium]|nr:glycosyltransferase family 4 protein [Terriglobia bacterium]
MARIGVNALYLIPGGVGGTEIYLRELLAALAEIDQVNEYLVFTNLETQSDLVPKQANFHWKPQAVYARFRPARILWEQIVLPFEAARYRLDALFNPGFTAPVFSLCRQVTVFHDLQHKRHPENFRWFDLPFWRMLLWAAVHRSDRLIAVSEATRSDLLRYYRFLKERIPKERVSVIAHGVEPAFSRLDRSHTESYLLCVSTLHPHKNLPRLIRAYGRKERDFPLILAGLRGFHTETIERLIEEMGLQDSVQITGWVPREKLYSLYERARAFVYPSMFEGFGMPVLEALAAGVPVACSDIPPLREVAGDAALFFDPLNEDAIAAGIERVMNDAPLRDRLAQTGRERARLFTWRQSAEQTLHVLTER